MTIKLTKVKREVLQSYMQAFRRDYPNASKRELAMTLRSATQTLANEPTNEPTEPRICLVPRTISRTQQTFERFAMLRLRLSDDNIAMLRLLPPEPMFETQLDREQFLLRSDLSPALRDYIRFQNPC